jgi:hypothetical protein
MSAPIGFYKSNGKTKPISKRKIHTGTMQKGVAHLSVPKHLRKKLPPEEKFFAGVNRTKTEATKKNWDSSVHISSPPLKDGILPEIEVYAENYPKFKKWQNGKGIKQDLAHSNQQLLDPTNPVDVKKWLNNPGKYDLIDVDTPNRDKDIIEVYRGMKCQQDKTLHELNHDNKGMVGKYWTGDIHVGQTYALRGTTSIATAQDLFDYDRKNDDYSKEHIVAWKKDNPEGTHSVPWNGIIFRYKATGDDVSKYNPEHYPWEQEAKIVADKPNTKTIADYHNNEIFIGFLIDEDSRRVAWHKVTKEDEDNGVKLKQIFARKPHEITEIEHIKKTGAEKEQIPLENYGKIVDNTEGVLKGAKGSDVGKALSEQQKEKRANEKQNKQWQKTIDKQDAETKKLKAKYEKEHPTPVLKSNDKKLNSIPINKSFNSYKVTYMPQSGSTSATVFQDYDQMIAFLKSSKPKAFNVFNPNGNVIIAKEHEGWNPHTKPTEGALANGKKVLGE